MFQNLSFYNSFLSIRTWRHFKFQRQIAFLKSYPHKSIWLDAFFWWYFFDRYNTQDKIHLFPIHHINTGWEQNKNLTLEAELIKLVLKKPGEGDLKPPAADEQFPPRDICLLQG